MLQWAGVDGHLLRFIVETRKRVRYIFSENGKEVAPGFSSVIQGSSLATIDWAIYFAPITNFLQRCPLPAREGADTSTIDALDATYIDDLASLARWPRTFGKSSSTPPCLISSST